MIEEYISYLEKKGYKKNTIRGKRWNLNEFFAYTKKREDSITKEDVERFYAELKGCGRYKSATIDDKLSAVRCYFKYLKEEGRILIDPAESIKIIWVRKSVIGFIPPLRIVKELIEKPDVETLMGKRDRAIFELFYTNGIRRGELINLDIYDVDLRNRHIFIRNGKGGKDRIVPIGEEAAKWLRTYIDIVRKRYLRNEMEKALFLSRNGLRVGSPVITTIFNRYSIRFEDNRRITPHRLRHACAIGMLKNRADIRAVQEILGHTRLSTTEVYTRLLPEDLKEAHRRYHPRGRMRT